MNVTIYQSLSDMCLDVSLLAGSQGVSNSEGGGRREERHNASQCRRHYTDNYTRRKSRSAGSGSSSGPALTPPTQTKQHRDKTPQ